MVVLINHMLVAQHICWLYQLLKTHFSLGDQIPAENGAMIECLFLKLVCFETNPLSNLALADMALAHLPRFRAALILSKFTLFGRKASVDYV